jgi:mannose-6-phosphate isomerase-like protein (cupin superfamily)
MKNIIVIAISLFVVMSVFTLKAQDKKDSVKYTIDNCINVFNPSKVEKTDAGFQYWFLDKNFADGKTVKLSVVKPHSATHAPHSHIEDEVFFILEGNAEFYLNGTWKTVAPNTTLYCPSNVMHGIRNPGNKELRYLVIKKYEKG